MADDWCGLSKDVTAPRPPYDALSYRYLLSTNTKSATPPWILPAILSLTPFSRARPTLAWRLARELHEGFERAAFLLGAKDEVAVLPLGARLEACEAVGLNGHFAGWRDVEIAAIGLDGVQYTGQVPRRPVVRRRHIADVRLC